MPAAPDPDDQRSWYLSPWLWTAVIVVVVGGALALSVLGRQQPTYDGEDVQDFCSAVRTYWEEVPALATLDLNAPPDAYAKIQADVVRVRETAPSAVAPDAKQVADGVEQLTRALEEIARRKAADPAYLPLEDASRAFTNAGRGRDRAVERFNGYVLQACGIDFANPPGTTPITTSAPSSIVTGSDSAPTTPTSAPTVGPPVPTVVDGPTSSRPEG